MKMAIYILKRTLLALFVLFVITTACFMVVRLLPANYETHLTPMEGMAKVDQLMRNTYRMYLIEKRHLQRHFQRCVTLAGRLPMALAVRENGKQCADTICDLIINYLEEQSHY